MDNAELLIELGTEEIPASLLEGTTRQLAELWPKICGRHASRRPSVRPGIHPDESLWH